MRAKQVNELIPKICEYENIVCRGIHFHRKTQNTSEWSLKYELEQTIKPEILQKIHMVNIGGGLPDVYKNSRPEIINQIMSKILELKKWLNQQKISTVIEPGRYLAAHSIELETSIKNIYENTIIVDCSVYNACMDAFVANIRLLVKGETDKSQGEGYTIKGMTPCSMDIFRYKVYLKNPVKGDKIIFENAGAYNFWTNFCNLKKIPTVITK